MSVITRISDVTPITRPSKVSAVRSLCADSAPRASRSVSEVRICDWDCTGAPADRPCFSQNPHCISLRWQTMRGYRFSGKATSATARTKPCVSRYRWIFLTPSLSARNPSPSRKTSSAASPPRRPAARAAFGTPLLGSWAFPRKAKGHLRPLADGPKMPLLFNSFCWLWFCRRRRLLRGFWMPIFRIGCGDFRGWHAHPRTKRQNIGLRADESRIGEFGEFLPSIVSDGVAISLAVRLRKRVHFRQCFQRLDNQECSPRHAQADFKHRPSFRHVGFFVCRLGNLGGLDETVVVAPADSPDTHIEVAHQSHVGLDAHITQIFAERSHQVPHSRKVFGFLGRELVPQCLPRGVLVDCLCIFLHGRQRIIPGDEPYFAVPRNRGQADPVVCHLGVRESARPGSLHFCVPHAFARLHVFPADADYFRWPRICCLLGPDCRRSSNEQ